MRESEIDGGSSVSIDKRRGLKLNEAGALLKMKNLDCRAAVNQPHKSTNIMKIYASSMVDGNSIGRKAQFLLEDKRRVILMK